MKFTKLFALVLTMSFAISGFSQSPGCCGVSYDDGLDIIERLEKNKKFLEEHGSVRGGILYVPIIFHLVANNDGSGRLDRTTVYNQLCRVNTDYASAEMVFYLKEIREVNNNAVYNSPTSNPAINAIIQEMGDGVNVFITENADTGGGLGTTLGFYNPTFD